MDGHPDHGLIPAHAGKTHNNLPPFYAVGAHPRSRGENCRLPDARRRVEGSSPLTRGKPPRGPPREVGAGLIPAHAGKTSTSNRRTGRGRAHPRSRGENRKYIGLPAVGPGSSPLTRGKPQRHCLGRVNLRLIPAHAGKTQCQSQEIVSVGAHPRSRGENARLLEILLHGAGSSPLTRGKRADHGDGPGRGGLIPAHAGKTTGSASCP